MTKKEIDRYLLKKIPLHVGFGYVMGLISGLGVFFFFH